MPMPHRKGLQNKNRDFLAKRIFNMQILLRFFPETPVRLDFSYYSKLAAAFYQVIALADPDFADDLHGGQGFRNRIKLFGFSPLHSRKTEIHPENKEQNRTGGLVFKGICSMAVCSPLPELMDRLSQGFSKMDELRIGSQIMRVQKGERVPIPDFREKMIWRLRQPASCVTSWSYKSENRKYYVFPGIPAGNKTCEALLRENLIHKWRRLKEIRPDIAKAWLQKEREMEKASQGLAEKDIHIRILPLGREQTFQRKRHQIKKAPVFSWIAPVQVTAPLAIQRVVWACGLGEMNSMGFGVVEEVR
ncbi:MAG: CRISPR-associated endoribonuclease Cas6 [Deltaproteobacteria bacterium]|nr:CRISPR-associated endoribonuclease Cas6 [Deltaproteobacteria bacterium]